MKTIRLSVDPADLTSEVSQSAIEQATSILRRGGLVAFPTETVYGLGANALSAVALEKIFNAKQRPAWDPIIVHISEMAMLATVAVAQHPGSCAGQLMNVFWPGPLTLLLPKTDKVPAIVTAGRPLVGVRMPAHPVAHALIASAGIPIAAPSANSFGRISPTTAAHVLQDLDGLIDAILDGGETAHGLESTVVDVTREPVVIYRPGIVTLQEIRNCCGTAIAWTPPASPSISEQPAPESLPSPGVGIRHYAPRARLVLIDGATVFAEAVRQAGREKRRFGIMLARNFLDPAAVDIASNNLVFDWGDWGDLPALAHRLFAGLRELDAAGVDLILCPLPPAVGIGAAIQDRLLKAARTT